MADIWCQIRVQGHLSAQWSEWFDGLYISNESEGETLLSGAFADDAALYGAIMKLRDVGLALLAVRRGTPDQEKTNEL